MTRRRIIETIRVSVYLLATCLMMLVAVYGVAWLTECPYGRLDGSQYAIQPHTAGWGVAPGLVITF
jgi:hypothetical protein